MGSRRKLKSERELASDIHKTFRHFCEQRKCQECPYSHSNNCKKDYILDLLMKSYEMDESAYFFIHEEEDKEE